MALEHGHPHRASFIFWEVIGLLIMFMPDPSRTSRGIAGLMRQKLNTAATDSVK